MKKLATILAVFIMTSPIQNILADEAGKIISHLDLKEIDLAEYKAKIQQNENPALSVDKEIKMLEQLTEFEFGRFLLKNKGLNGYYTSYVILYGMEKDDLHPLEEWLIKKSPVILATRERFGIFQEQLQKRLKSGMSLASTPCGMMDDLLRLDYSNIENVKLTGIDLDKYSLDMAKENAESRGFVDNVSFLNRNAWDLGLEGEYDIIASNGLNIYEPDDAKVTELYKEFAKALKPDGILIASFLTPPPALDPNSPWENFDKENLVKQKAIFADIIGVHWQVFRTEETTRKQLDDAGFEIVEIVYDKQKMFPTVVAKKHG